MTCLQSGITPALPPPLKPSSKVFHSEHKRVNWSQISTCYALVKICLGALSDGAGELPIHFVGCLFAVYGDISGCLSERQAWEGVRSIHVKTGF